MKLFLNNSTEEDASPAAKGVHGMKILVLNGPNMNLLGLREPEIYGPGRPTGSGILAEWQQPGGRAGINLRTIQPRGHRRRNSGPGRRGGIVINPGYSHQHRHSRRPCGVVDLPAVEVHIRPGKAGGPTATFPYTGMACHQGHQRKRAGRLPRPSFI